MATPEQIAEYNKKWEEAVEHVFSIIDASDWKKEKSKEKDVEIYLRHEHPSPFAQVGYIVEHEFVEVYAFGKVPRYKPYRTELGVIEDMRFKQNGRGYVKLFAYIRKINEKLRVRKFIVPSVSYLL